MIRVTKQISLEDSEIDIDFVRSSGPGGQNVNKVATAAQLRFNLGKSTAIPPEVRQRLIRLAGKKMTSNMELIITARRFRVQERNRRDAIDRLITLIRKAAEKPKVRRKTKPTKASNVERLEKKQKRSRIKIDRKKLSVNED